MFWGLPTNLKYFVCPLIWGAATISCKYFIVQQNTPPTEGDRTPRMGMENDNPRMGNPAHGWEEEKKREICVYEYV